MSRFYVDPDGIKGDKIYIEGAEAHHIADVMRLKAGERICAFDGMGNEFSGVITHIGSKRAVVDITEKRSIGPNKARRVTLVQAVPKKSIMDYIVEKSTELGVDVIVPLWTDRTIVKPDEKGMAGKLSRWRRISIEASKQCGRSIIPQITAPKTFAAAVAALDKHALALIPHLGGGTSKISDALRSAGKKDIIIFIGPEGDFTAKEVSEAVKNGAIPVTLGPNVLRCDTAAVASLSIIGYESGKI
ncbi:MAG: hypothetical protein AUJ75_01320 [Candidatus Omnitrophica bacterium CG1_02_49_10]|nr:MAG: hypothetical protein AUJ75_01320 [Candidatus Omnitrophica bacterium CG1_02_49_10]